jgi:hypothetical protein
LPSARPRDESLQRMVESFDLSAIRTISIPLLMIAES